MKTMTALALLAATLMTAACARHVEPLRMPQRQEAMDRYERCHEDSIGDANHDRTCRDEVPL